MKVYQNLQIHLKSLENQHFVDDLKYLIEKSNWKIRQDFIDNYKKNSFSSSKIVLCVETDKYKFEDKDIKGALWMWDYNGYLEVFNIIPLIDNSLDYDEYNFLLNKFYENFIKQLCIKYEANIILTKPEKQIIETIGDDALKSLLAFSNGANKSTGNSHPYDFERWCEFIFIVFRNGIEVGVDELIEWFEENGWSNDMAHKLGLDFEYSLDLLEKYEQN
ncbi:hypothetical protein [Flavobacterium sharifuzzamanii]|uniref:hypothetical protein n=1 Tax=Flavobacterium sharifuzzamanii TaxID=2211133 RepID=UPI000DAC41C5|nr:hypothetical protein [Flavobacterium sharifuzzamanii]KAF2079980.1 hypothetical protein DMA14_16265 [Flavobacterium sharifuzzamanii]